MTLENDLNQIDERYTEREEWLKPMEAALSQMQHENREWREREIINAYIRHRHIPRGLALLYEGVKIVFIKYPDDDGYYELNMPDGQKVRLAYDKYDYTNADEYQKGYKQIEEIEFAIELDLIERFQRRSFGSEFAITEKGKQLIDAINAASSS